MATKEKEEVETEREDSPLLDLSDDAVKKMIKVAKKRGYVTMDELNAVLPCGGVSAAQIEDSMDMVSEMGIKVVEDEEAGEDAESDDDDTGTELADVTGTAVAVTQKKEPTDRTDDPVRMYLREM